MRVKTASFLFLIAVLLHGGCESRHVPPELSQFIEPSIVDLVPASVESPMTLPPPDTGAVSTRDSVTDPTLASPIAQETPDGTSIHIIDHNGNGTVVATLPIYRSEHMRYFAAGVGRLERAATYPRFPVKLVFSRSSGDYLSFIAVTVLAQDGTHVLQIPASHVKGPWVFLTCWMKHTVSRRSKALKHKRVQILPSKQKAGQQRIISFMWP